MTRMLGTPHSCQQVGGYLVSFETYVVFTLCLLDSSRHSVHSKQTSTKLSVPSVSRSVVDELKRLLRYRNSRSDFTLVATQPKTPSTDEWTFHVDFDLAGETSRDTRRRTGARFLLNKMPVHWMSKREPQTAFSSATSEVFAFSECILRSCQRRQAFIVESRRPGC